VDGALDDPVALELAQGAREHALADAVDLALELREPHDTALEQGDREQRPLVRDPVEDLADLATLPRVPLPDVDALREPPRLGISRVTRCG
jgi:hypothetical protein